MNTASHVAVKAAAISQKTLVPIARPRLQARAARASDRAGVTSTPSGERPIDLGSRRMTVAASASAANTPTPKPT